MRFSIVLWLCVVFGLGTASVEAATAQEVATSHNAMWGARGTRDVLLTRDTVKETFKPLRVISKDYEFRQKPERFPYVRTITRIVVTDQYTDGDGGYATLKSGGPGLDFVILHLKSQRGHGFHFTIDIYGQ